MIRIEGLSKIHPACIATSPKTGEDLSLEIEKALGALVLGLVKEAHDAASRYKVIAELHKVERIVQQRHKRALEPARLKLQERRMTLLENEQHIRRRELELKQQAAEAKQQPAENQRLKLERKAGFEAPSPLKVNEPVNASAPVHATPAAETEVKQPDTHLPSAKDLDAAVQAIAAATAGMTPSPAPTAALVNMTGNRKERRRAKYLLRKADQKAAKELKRNGPLQHGSGKGD